MNHLHTHSPHTQSHTHTHTHTHIRTHTHNTITYHNAGCICKCKPVRVHVHTDIPCPHVCLDYLDNCDRDAYLHSSHQCVPLPKNTTMPLALTLKSAYTRHVTVYSSGLRTSFLFSQSFSPINFSGVGSWNRTDEDIDKPNT